MFNVTRTYPAPASLALRKNYSDEDVITSLKEIFFDKCYLCEIKEPTSLNVEHFDAHQGDENKKFDWDNLYYVCGRCNNIKLAEYNNLLDCTDPDIDVFLSIKHLPPRSPYQKQLEIIPMDDEAQTLETAELLKDIFNSDRTVNKQITSVYLRKNVFARYNRLLELVNQYFDNESSDEIKMDALSRMKVLMHKKQEHSAFLRWMVKEDFELNNLLGAHIV